MKLSVAASCLLCLPIPTAMASTAKATKANTSPHTANTSPNKIIHSEYFLGPVSCPKHCASGANFGGILAADNVQQCNPDDKYQRWLIHQVSDGGGEVIKAESPENAGRCLGVATHGGDDMLGGDIAPSPNEESCNGQLALVDCQHPSAEWLSSGALLYSAPCWTQGHSAALTVNEDCTSLGLSLAGNGAPTPITRAQSFMLLEPSFVETIAIVDDPPTISPSPAPVPPITLTECGESFTNEKVVLSDNLDCGPFDYDDYDDDFPMPQACAVTLDGSDAELNCEDYTLSQEASGWYINGPFRRGICLFNGAKAKNCNVQQFPNGIHVTERGEVVNSNLTSNYYGVFADFKEDSTSTVTIEDTDASNNEGAGLFIRVDGDGTNAELNVKGKVTFNSNNGDNGNGIYTSFYSDATNSYLEINVEDGSTLTTCGHNGVRPWSSDIYGIVPASATLEFSGDGYTCDEFLFDGEGTVVPPTCQACP